MVDGLGNPLRLQLTDGQTITLVSGLDFDRIIADHG